MKKEKLLHEGKAKKIYATEDDDYCIVEYKDTATAFDGLKKEDLENKGILNNAITTIFFKLLEEEGIPTHFVKQLNKRDMLVKRLEIIPVEVVVRNIAAGSLAKRLGMEEGLALKKTVLELSLKNDELHDPMLNQYHVYAMELAGPQELARMEELALKINSCLVDYLMSRDIVLVDFKLEFGRHKNEIILGDEISPDTCRFWDAASSEKMDKDRFRRDMGEVMEAYQDVLSRLQQL